jgi:hypothetical protein
MSRFKAIILSVVVLTLGLAVFGWYFFSTGGAGLYRTVVNYLLADIPDKKHDWWEFIYKGENSSVSGFYSGGDEESIKIWTLSGLKRFYAKPKFSTYSFRDTCAVVRQLQQEGGGQRGLNNEEVYFDLGEWQSLLVPENYVTVWLAGKENGQVVIDKTLGRSGKYKVLGKIEKGVCD